MPQAGDGCGQIVRENNHTGGTLGNSLEGRTLLGKIPLGYAELPQEVL